jgi:hypothetical protein
MTIARSILFLYLIAVGHLKATEMEGSKVCARETASPIMPPAFQNPMTTTDLQKCDEQALYYGFEHAVDPASALQCAYFQRAHPGPNIADPFYGPGVLAMLYANGKGVSRDYNLAIRFACEITWSDEAETRLRAQRLEELRNARAQTTTFDLCDDGISTIMAGACAHVQWQLAERKRTEQQTAITAKWSSEAKWAYDRVDATEKAFQYARAGNEIDQTGSSRNVFVATEASLLGEQKIINLRELSGGIIPQASSAHAAASDEELAAVYEQILQLPADTWTRTTVRPDGVRTTQHAWLEMRDAWVDFGRIAYPNVSAERIRVRITRQRIHQMRSLLRSLGPVN